MIQTICLSRLSAKQILEKPLASIVGNSFVQPLPALPPTASTDRFLLLQSVSVQLSKSPTLPSKY